MKTTLSSIVALGVALSACGSLDRSGVSSNGATDLTPAQASASSAGSSASTVARRAPECVGAARVDACNAGELGVCLDAADLAFQACDFAEDDLGFELVKRACSFGAPQGCLTYGTLLFTRLPAPRARPDVALGLTTLMGVCDGAKPRISAAEAEVRRAACDRLSLRLAAAGDATWETFATKACELGRVDACVRLAAKVPGAPYLAELTKLCLMSEVGLADRVGAPLLERERDPNRLLRVCAAVLTKRGATFESTPEGKAVRARAGSLDVTGLLGFYLGTDPAPDADPGSVNDRLVLLGQTACSVGDDRACVESRGGEFGSGTCTLLLPESCANWAKGIVSSQGLEPSRYEQAERVAARACYLDDRTCDALGRAIRHLRPQDVMHARDAFSRACRAGNSAACREGDAP